MAQSLCTAVLIALAMWRAAWSGPQPARGERRRQRGYRKRAPTCGRKMLVRGASPRTCIAGMRGAVRFPGGFRTSGVCGATSVHGFTVVRGSSRTSRMVRRMRITRARGRQEAGSILFADHLAVVHQNKPAQIIPIDVRRQYADTAVAKCREKPFAFPIQQSLAGVFHLKVPEIPVLELATLPSRR